MHLRTVRSFDDIENPIEKEDSRLLALGKSKIGKSHETKKAHVENQKRRIRDRRAKELINNDNQAADQIKIG